MQWPEYIVGKHIVLRARMKGKGIGGVEGIKLRLAL
jgi:hypothetical protein